MPKLAEYNQCTGCGLCSGVCPYQVIDMKLNDEGFYYPITDDKKCMDCGLCEKACPVKKQIPKKEQGVAYAAWIKQDKERKYSTSGGIFTALYEKILSYGGCVFGAAFDEKLILSHICAEDEDDCRRMRGSKYIQSNASSSYRLVKQKLSEGRWVLYSGTPCQIDALNSYVGENDRLITCEVLCHGVGSNGYFYDLLKNSARRRKKEICDVRFREKSKGWEDSQFVISYEDGKKERSPSYFSLFGYPFSRQIITRLSCLECAYSNSHRVADITLGDYSGRDKQQYSARERKKGISLLVINTEKGRELINSISAQLILEKKSLDELATYVPAMQPKHTESELHERFFLLYREGGLEAVLDRFATPPKKEVFYFQHRRAIQGIYRVMKKLKIK